MNKALVLLFVGLGFVAAVPAQQRDLLQSVETIARAWPLDASAHADRLQLEARAAWLLELRAAARQKDVAAGTRLLQQVETMDAPATVTSLCRDLLDAIQQERNSRNQELAGRVDAAVKRAQGACQTAQAESDLNEMLRELARLADDLQGEPSEPKIQGMTTRLEWTEEAVNAWQNVLAFRAAGYDDLAKKTGSEARSFVDGTDDFTGPRNVRASMNSDGSADVTWGNLPGTEGEISIRDMDARGHWVTIAVAPAGATSCHIPSDSEKQRDEREKAQRAIQGGK